jgi:hypothetical protein
MDENIPLPVDPPAVALKWAHCRVSWFPAANGCFSSIGTAGLVKSGMPPFHPQLGRLPSPPARSLMGHEGRLPTATVERLLSVRSAELHEGARQRAQRADCRPSRRSLGTGKFDPMRTYGRFSNQDLRASESHPL